MVTGITAASAMASELGVSLTHREHARSVRFITGHSKFGKLPEDINWNDLASGDTTCVLYMAGRTANQLQQRLLAVGMDARTPVVICSSVSRDDEQRWSGFLSELNIGIEVTGYENPVLIGIGEVFAQAGAVYRKTADQLSA